MLHNLFGKDKKPIRRDPDRIWRSRELELGGLLTFIAFLDPATTRVLVITHFIDTLRLLEQQFAARDLDFRSYLTRFEGHRLQTPAEYQDAGCVLLALSEVLPETSSIPVEPAAPGNIGTYVLVAEHHPLPGLDDRVLEFARHLPGLHAITFHEALDGAFLHYCGGMEVSRLVTTLQIPDDECISNPMIDKSVRLAQEKINRRVANPMPADSGEQLFQKNLPNRA